MYLCVCVCVNIYIYTRTCSVYWMYIDDLGGPNQGGYIYIHKYISILTPSNIYTSLLEISVESWSLHRWPNVGLSHCIHIFFICDRYLKGTRKYTIGLCCMGLELSCVLCTAKQSLVWCYFPGCFAYGAIILR